MKEISANKITEAVKTALLKANTDLTATAPFLKAARDNESNPIGREVLNQLVENVETAKVLNIPSCQDTGMAVVFCSLGQNVHISGGGIEEAINKGVRLAYKEGGFRKSVLDPLTRINTKDNTPAIVHYTITDGDNLELWVLPKGFGSENMSEIAMLTPAAGLDGVLDFIVDVVKRKGANACPPLFIGVGIGGTFEKCALLAKHSLLREPGSLNKDGELNKLEQQLLDRINKLDIGPMGLGGKATAMGVFIEKYPTHIAGLPVAVNIMCHALRHERVVL
ncbi:MAG: fumarate hydratase [Clostridia bacterium]|nr:fumarate hydratase [Clostridia bacterium]